MRQDILDRIMYFQKHNTEELLPESKRYVERLIKIGKRNGSNMDGDYIPFDIFVF